MKNAAVILGMCGAGAGIATDVFHVLPNIGHAIAASCFSIAAIVCIFHAK